MHWKTLAERLWKDHADTGWTGDAVAMGQEEFERCIGLATGNLEPRHQVGCICADCSGAELTADND